MNPVTLFFKSFYKQDFLHVYWNVEKQYVWKTPEDKSKQVIKELQKFYGKKEIVLTQSGRSAIRLAIRSLGLQKKKIAVPSFICASLCRAVTAEHATIVFIDINPDFSINLPSLRQAVKRQKIDAIIAPHLGGIATNIKEVIAICKENNILVIEDAAQSLGLTIKNQHAGSFGDVTILSFGIGKMISSFAGGALVINNTQYTAKNEELLSSKEPSKVQRISFLCRYFYRKITLPFFLVIDTVISGRRDVLLDVRAMSKTDSAIILYQMKKIDEIVKKRAANASVYLKQLHSKTPPKKNNVFLKFMISCKDQSQRNKLVENLRMHYVETEGTYTPQHLRKPWSNCPKTGLQNTMKLYPTLITLPCHPGLSQQDIARICTIANEVLDE